MFSSCLKMTDFTFAKLLLAKTKFVYELFNPNKNYL